MKIVQVIASILGLAMFAAIGIYALPYILAFSGFMLGVVIVLALAQAAWKAFRG